MQIDKKLLELIACPKCKGSVAAFDNNTTLLCKHCKIKYPVRDGIPVMIAVKPWMRTPDLMLMVMASD